MTYQHDLAILLEAIDEVTEHKKLLTDAKSDIERLAAIEKIVAYSSLLTNVATWTLTGIRHPRLKG
jgi:hypothetical protein